MSHLHSTLSITSSSALFHDISRPLKSSFTTSVQFFHGILLLFHSSGTQCNIWLALLSLFMRHTWSSHLSLLFLMMFSMSSCPVLSLILLFVILTCHHTCKFSLATYVFSCISLASSFLLFATVICQASDSYNSVLTTMALYSLNAASIYLPDSVKPSKSSIFLPYVYFYLSVTATVHRN